MVYGTGQTVLEQNNLCGLWGSQHIGGLHCHNKIVAGVVMPVCVRLLGQSQVKKFVLSNVPVPVHASRVHCYLNL